MSRKRFLIVDELIIAIKKMNTRQPYSIPQSNLLLLVTVLVVIGSLVPWKIEGDFVSTWRYGVQLFPMFADNGSVIVSLPGIFIIGLVFRSDVFVKHPVKRLLISAVALFIISAYHIVDLHLYAASLRME